MTDLVERLRSKEINSGLCGEAADEIERLREVRNLAALLTNECGDDGQYPPSIGTLERLRDAIITSRKVAL